MTSHRHANRLSYLSGSELENALACIEKGHQLGGNQPSTEALDRARRLLTGTISIEEGEHELAAKYGYSYEG